LQAAKCQSRPIPHWIVAETKGAGDKFVITAIRPIPFQVRSGDDLAELLQSLITLFL
jgi:hypothetical protein